MTSQDFRIGFRWMIQPAAGIGVMAAQPVFAQQPQYEPAPEPQYAAAAICTASRLCAAAAALEPRLMRSGLAWPPCACQKDERAADVLDAKVSHGVGTDLARALRRTVP